ncbi:MAG: DNA repair protein RecO [Eubacteriales bacterium]|nr:DNA repair protein RecO [Eubacteriales bacterium]
MAAIKLRALGLREVDFGDYDRYLTALTDAGRRVEVLCKNVRRGKRQIPAARQLCYAELIVSERAGRYALREAALVHSFFPLAQDIERYALACYLVELTAALTTPDEDAPAVCRLLLHALHALEGKKRDPVLVKAAFEWRLMAESGYAPDLTACGVCGEAIEQPPLYFSVGAGTAADARCAQRIGGYEPLAEGTLRALAHVLSCPVPRTYAFALGGAAREQFSRLGEQYVLYHLGRGFDSLAFYRSLVPPVGDARPCITSIRSVP